MKKLSMEETVDSARMLWRQVIYWHIAAWETELQYVEKVILFVYSLLPTLWI